MKIVRICEICVYSVGFMSANRFLMKLIIAILIIVVTQAKQIMITKCMRVSRVKVAQVALPIMVHIMIIMKF